MEKSKLLYWTDVGLGISFVITFITGVVKFRAFLPLFFWTYRIFPPRQMAFIHDWFGFLMGVFVLIHLILHWNWIVAMTKNLFKEK